MKATQGIAGGHAYSVLGAYPITDGGRTVATLLLIRNPWAREGWKGDWSDSSRKWTNAYKKQVPYMKRNDGAYFISTSDFIRVFQFFSITYYHDDWSVSYYEKKGFATKSVYDYKFTLKKAQEVYVGADIYV
jgi:calpain-15